MIPPVGFAATAVSEEVGLIVIAQTGDREVELDCDATIKPLCGHQAEAVASYSPKKPGCPSHLTE